MNIEEVLKRWIGVTEDMARIIRDLQTRNDVLEKMNAKQAETIREMMMPVASELWVQKKQIENQLNSMGLTIDDPVEDDIATAGLHARILELESEVVSVRNQLRREGDSHALTMTMSADYSKQIENQLNSMGLTIDGDDFGTNRPRVVAMYEDRAQDIKWRPLRKQLAHINGIPVYVSGLVGTAPGNWDEIDHV